MPDKLNINENIPNKKHINPLQLSPQFSSTQNAFCEKEINSRMTLRNVKVRIIFFSFIKCFFKILVVNIPALGEVANFGTDYFLKKIKFLAKYKRVFTTKFVVVRNRCCWIVFLFV